MHLMHDQHQTRCASRLPEIISIVLRQAYRHLNSGAIPRAIFERQIDRLTREELAPRGLELDFTEDAPGYARFVITARDGEPVELIEFGHADEAPASSRNEITT